MSDAKAIWLKEVLGFEVKGSPRSMQVGASGDVAAAANGGTAAAPSPPPPPALAAAAEPSPPMTPPPAAPPPAAEPRPPLSREEARSFADLGALIDATNQIVARR